MQHDRLKQYEEDLKAMRPLDDDFMREMFRNNIPLAEFVLRIILDKPDLRLLTLETQYDLKRLVGARSICLDGLGTDDQGRKYDIEVQRSTKGAKPRRARYHSSSMDVEFLEKNQDFDELPETYTIFITEDDVFRREQAVYRIERTNTTTGEPFDDGAHILYVNGAYVGDSAIGKLMHDFRCTSADDMYLAPMAERTRYFKETPEGVSQMCEIVENRVNQARYEGIMEGKYKVAEKLLKRGDSIEEIADIMELPLDTIQEIAARIRPATAS